jgi:DNA-binding transcriptional ArsR family regulator
MADALTALIVDDDALARDELAVAIAAHVRLTKGGALLLEPSFNDLPSDRQVLCVLLALKALKLLGFRESDSATPQEIVDLSGMAPGTVRPKLSALLKARLVTKQGHSYSLPVHSARRAIDLLGS